MMHSEKRLIAFYPYVPATANFMEKWLTKKAAAGWKLEDVHGWKFVFRRCKPYVGKYFSNATFGRNKGIYNDYWISKKLYSRSNSTLNKLNLQIYEVDVKKIDQKFTHMILFRNKFYLKHYFSLFLFALINIILTIGLTKVHNCFYLFLMFEMVLLVYSIFAVIILICKIKSSLKERNIFE